MKKFLSILLIFISLIFLNSCAKPTVVEVIMPEDQKLNCEELEEAIGESKKIKREAEYAKEGTGGNIARMMLFWPAWAQTLHNADVAIIAADNRIYHLIKIMKKKKCKNIDKVRSEITDSAFSQNNITRQLKELNEMYKSGALTKEEFDKAKTKVLEK